MDFRDFSGGNSAPSQDFNRRWWALSGRELANAVSATCKTLVDAQAPRQRQAVISARMYGNLSLYGAAGVRTESSGDMRNAMRDRVTYNLVQSIIDTATSKIGENKPKPYFLTSNGNYRAQRHAKKLNQFVDGIFYENEAFDLGGDAFRDGCIWGDGIVHVYERDERVAFERVISAELLIDEEEAKNGRPRQMHRLKSVDRMELADWFPSKKAILRDANRYTGADIGLAGKTSDLILVRESWHLPSGVDATDGKHAITIDGEELFTEKWEHQWFPFSRFTWSPRPLGYWSQGLAEQLQGIQLEVSKLLWLVQRSHQLGGSFKVFLENGSKIVKEHINNDIGAIINYTGTPPTFFLPQIVPPEIYQHLATLIQRGYEQAGISQLSAVAKKPDGLNSGKAIREYKDEQSDRFRTIGRYNEKMYLDAARLAICTAKDIAKKNRGHYEVKVPGRKFLEKVDWSDIDLEDDEYVMQCFPVSRLPSDPAGRLQTIQEYVQAGFIDPRQARRLLDFPDLDQVESLANATEEIITTVLDKICDEGEYSPPEPTDDLTLAKQLVLEYIARGRAQQLEPERLSLLRKWSSQVDDFMAKAQAAAQAQMAAMQPPGAMPGAPQASAAPPPQSDLLPFAGAA